MEHLLVLPKFTVIVFWFFFVLSLGSFLVSVVLTVGVVLLICWYRLRRPPASNVAELGIAPYVIAHRGAGFDAPENTVAAFKRAKENGAVAVEFDVDYTADGVAVVFHDHTVDRCTNGTGRIDGLTLEQLQQLNASASHHKRDLFPNERIPTLDRIVEFCLENNLLMYIDLKTNIKLSTEKILDLYKRYPDLYKKAAVCSFNPLILYSIRSKDRNIVGGLTHRSRYLSRKVDKTESEGSWFKKLIYPCLDIVLEWSHYTWLWFLCGNTFFLQNLGDVCESTVDHFKERGVQVVVWTVNRPDDRNYFMRSLLCPIMTDTMNKEGCGLQKN